MAQKHTETGGAAPALAYRPEIDGLRAIAVLAVVLFHARLGVLGGGYAGVDVFFVISGFLISRLIAQELERSGRFSLSAFYERRIRRLFPALLVMVASVLALGWWQLPPGELVALARSAFAALAFFSNLHFAKEAGYFQPRAETQPLLHTWSLGVEEQFYILAPFIIVGLMRLGPRWRGMVVAVLALVSLGMAVIVPFHLREAGFFWPHLRAYELLAGVALGLRVVPLPSGQGARAVLAVLGLVLIGLALVFLPGGIAFPSFWALLPCLGAAMVLGATEGGAIPGPCGALLRARPMRFFGRISYSLYLWHWPVFVYVELAQEGPVSLPLRLGLIGVAVGLSWTSWRMVETPARHGQVRSRVVAVFAPVAGVIALAFALSLHLWNAKGYPGRFGPAMIALSQGLAEPRRAPARCDGDLCFLGAEGRPIRFILWGDSHARVLAPELGDVAAERGLAGVLLMRDGCPPLLGEDGQSMGRSPKCRDVTGRLNALLAEHPGITLIIAARWALYAEAAPFGEETGTQARPLVRGGLAANRAAFAAGLGRTIEGLAGLGAQVRLFGPIPEQMHDIPARMARRLMRSGSDDPGVSRSRFDARQIAVLPAILAAQGKGARLFWPHEAFCDATFCRASEGAAALYFDNNHVSPLGALRLRPLLAKALE